MIENKDGHVSKHLQRAMRNLRNLVLLSITCDLSLLMPIPVMEVSLRIINFYVADI